MSYLLVVIVKLSVIVYSFFTPTVESLVDIPIFFVEVFGFVFAFLVVRNACKNKLQ